jgi:hypothetical protein
LLLKSEAISKIDYRIVHPANGDLILKEEFWPADARWILTEFLMSDEGAQRGNVTPRFILANNKKIVFTTTGNVGWKEKMWPKIEDVTGTKG